MCVHIYIYIYRVISAAVDRYMNINVYGVMYAARSFYRH